MFEEYASAVNVLGLEQVIERDDTAKIPENINLMRYCVDMYDQEFMVKVNSQKKKQWMIHIADQSLGVY